MLFNIFSVCAHKNDIYITGGHSNSGMTVDTVSVYFSCINQWSMLASMHYPRERHGSASVDGTVYVAGKSLGFPRFASSESVCLIAGGLMASTKNRKKPGVLNSVERYRPMCNRWEKVKPLPKRCYSPGMFGSTLSIRAFIAFCLFRSVVIQGEALCDRRRQYDRRY